MVLFVPKVHVFNFPLFFILSFFCRVKTYEIVPFMRKFNRIEVLDLLGHLGWDECVITQEEAVGISEDILKMVPDRMWSVRVRGRVVDLSLRIKQDMFRETERLLYLKKILLLHKSACLVDSLMISFLSFFEGGRGELFNYPKMKWLSCLNVFMDRLYLFSMNMAFFFGTMCRFVYGLARNMKIKKNIRYIYESDNPYELNAGKDKITFTWIVDDNIIKRDDILFVIPSSSPKKKDGSGAGPDKDMLTVSLPDIFTAASIRSLIYSLPDILGAGAKALFSIFSIRSLLLSTQLFRILRWLPLVDSFSPKVYIYSFASAGIENPAVSYFNDIGIKTVSWSYSTSLGRFLTGRKPEGFRFRTERVSNIMSGTLVVWNRNFKDFVMEHPQKKLDIEVIGPLMPGDESVVNIDKKILCERFSIPYGIGKRYITVFDAPATLPIFTKSYFLTPAEYKRAFTADVIRLIKELDGDIVLLLKTKRNLDDAAAFYTDEIKGLINSMRDSRKFVVLDNTINPWIPISIADMCVNLPFGSSNMAALHYGKPAIFHDPLNLARYPRYKYDKLNPIITHGFDELKEMAFKFLSDGASFKKFCDDSEISEYIGREKNLNSSLEFRKFLKALAEDGYGSLKN